MIMDIHESTAGLGLRRSMSGNGFDTLLASLPFVELAPENWIGVGGYYGRWLREISERVPVVAHGLSLSIGGIAGLNEEYIHSIKRFLEQHQVAIYSEHLSFSDDGGQLYDLLPLPFTDEAVKYVVDRIRQVQDMLERKIVLENVSYYLATGGNSSACLREEEFINAVLSEADCELLLDVTNVYVNSINHDYSPVEFIRAMPSARIRYYHVAGHFVEDDGLIIDTHGADVVDPVWRLLSETYRLKGVKPTLLERDFNIPEAATLTRELATIMRLQQEAQQHAQRQVA